MNGYQIDAMMIVNLCKRHRQHTTAITSPIGVPDMLALMDVTTGHIVGMVGPAFHTHLLYSTDNNLLAGIFWGDISSLGIHMGHHDQWLFRILLAGF